MALRFLTAFTIINIPMAIDIMGSIMTKPVNFITTEPTNTTIHPKVSSSICRFTDFWFKEDPLWVTKAATKLTQTPITDKTIIPL